MESNAKANRKIRHRAVESEISTEITNGGDTQVEYDEEEEYEEKKTVPSDNDPFVEEGKTTGGEPYFAFFAALILMSLMLAVWLFSALYFGRWFLP